MIKLLKNDVFLALKKIMAEHLNKLLYQQIYYKA